MVTGTRPASTPRAGPPAGGAAHRLLTVGVGAVLGQALAFAVLLGVTGSPGWWTGRLVLTLVVGISAVWLEHHAARGVRGVIAIGLGLVGLTAGVGIGVMHVVKSDITLIAVAALAAMVAGLVLIGIGVGRLWTITPGWWRLLGLPAAFLLVEFIVIPVTTAVYATNVPATHLASVTPADRGFGYQDVHLMSSDGVRLSAW